MEVKQKHILIVDDNLKNLEITAKILQDEGYMISLSEDAKSAIKMLEDYKPDLILLDIMMPGIDGLEFCRIIKKDKRTSDIPVIFLTAKTDSEDLTEGFRAGGVDYITKPFRREELLVRVKNHLDLAGSKEEIIEMNRMRDKIYSVISHDIRSPLSSIIFVINALKSGILDPTSDEFLEIIDELEKTTAETSTLLDNLLAFTRIQNKNIPFNPRELELSLLVNECILMLAGIAEKKNIRISQEIQDDLKVFCDETSTQAVMRNIIFNSVKYTPEGGNINIRCKGEKEMVSIDIEDSGVGIQPEKVKKIFLENQHYTSMGTNGEKGSGLGIFIIKDYLSRNNGSLEVESIPGKGTIIRITLPAS